MAKLLACICLIAALAGELQSFVISNKCLKMIENHDCAFCFDSWTGH
jgi:hypothetical protein